MASFTAFGPRLPWASPNPSRVTPRTVRRIHRPSSVYRAGVPAGASERRWTAAKERLDGGTPLGQLRIDDVPVDDLRLQPLVPCDVREDYHPEGECPTPFQCPTPKEK